MGYEKWCRAAVKFQTASLTICGTILVTLLTANGLGRYILHRGLSWSDEVVRIMFVWGCFIGMTSAFITDGHIGFDTFAKLNTTTLKISRFINGSCLVAIGVAVAVYGTQFTNRMGKFPLPASHIPIGYLYSAGVVAGVIWIIIGIGKIIYTFKANRKEER